MRFIRGKRTPTNRRFSKSRAEALADAFSTLYSGTAPLTIDDPLVAQLVAREIDRQKKKVTTVIAEWKRLDPLQYQKQVSQLSRFRGLDRAFFELRKETAQELHLPLALFDYSWHAKKLDISPMQSIGENVRSDEFLVRAREPGSRQLAQFLSPAPQVPASQRSKMTRNEAWASILKPFEIADKPKKTESEKKGG